LGRPPLARRGVDALARRDVDGRRARAAETPRLVIVPRGLPSSVLRSSARKEKEEVARSISSLLSSPSSSSSSSSSSSASSKGTKIFFHGKNELRSI